LFYVALTRAEEQAVLSYAQRRFKYGEMNFPQPSRFLGEIDQVYLDIEDGGFREVRGSDYQDDSPGRFSKGFNQKSSFTPKNIDFSKAPQSPPPRSPCSAKAVSATLLKYRLARTWNMNGLGWVW
jgi:DNA helicase II / ATP-dependent DNA helicase PcrA